MLTFLGVLSQPMHQHTAKSYETKYKYLDPRLLFCQCKTIKVKKKKKIVLDENLGLVSQIPGKSPSVTRVSQAIFSFLDSEEQLQITEVLSLSDFQSKFKDHSVDIQWCDNAILLAKVVLFLSCLVI